jgi:hypothetical protein
MQHMHTQMDTLMLRWLLEWRAQAGRGNRTPQQCKQQCVDFFKNLPADKIAADTNTLPATWQAIITARGDYIAPGLS